MRELCFDFPGLEIGIAEYDEGPTGLTVFHFPEGAMATVDVRGGAAATINTDRLRSGYDQPTVRAVFFAGGSSYGLEAASGIMAELLARRGHQTSWRMIPTVTGAVVFDFGGRNNAVHPDKPLGRLALQSARANCFPLGARGAGRSVAVGKVFGPAFKESAGQGGAFRQLGPTRLAAFTVLNSVGVLVDRQGQVVRGNRDPSTGRRSTLASDLNDGSAPRKRAARASALRALETPGAIADPAAQPEEGNTTLTLIATSERLTYPQLSRLAVQTHTSLARAIQPFHTAADGDVLFAVATGETANPELDFEDLAAHAAELAWDAALSAVPPPE